MVTRIPSCIFLYNGSRTESLKLEEIAKYLRQTLGNTEIRLREDFVSLYLQRVSPDDREQYASTFAEKFAKSRIRQIENKNQEIKPFPMEVDYEKRNLFYKFFGVLYNGFKLRILFSEMIPESESAFDFCHIIFTNQLFGTWDENDCRWHARVAIYGLPSIISTSGIVEAPAKPREFYLKRQMGISSETLKNEFSGRFIDYDDSRLTEVMKGYVMQAIFYQLTGDPFCNDKNCRLYNAHWQEEVIQAQLDSNNEFCQKHQKIIGQIIRAGGE